MIKAESLVKIKNMLLVHAAHNQYKVDSASIFTI